ncbi:MAG: histidine--tRNA ligase [Spirochaetaceae bacterium]|nr:histidine--tRNA ligase [Spirochaetaceae bacterium]
MAVIEPRVLKGFRDMLPEAEMARARLVRTLESVFASFGFVPIDTPVLEYAEILLGKGGGETDKQVYRFRDHGDRDVAMRFDLTVPFARFMAEHVDELYLPFRRYHIAKVWRGENTQRGRYREFMQCDFDIVGTDAASADADIVLTACTAMQALDVGEFTVRINHRALFNRFLARRGLASQSVPILRTVDKLEKIGAQATEAQLASIAGEDAARDILDFIHRESSLDATLNKMIAYCEPGDAIAAAARQRILQVAECVEAAGHGGHLVLDPSITRGLDYYTGIVLETTLGACREIGSVCSGGRYDELASLYTTRKLPGVGASVGLDRLLAALDAAGRAMQVPAGADVLIVHQEHNNIADLHALAQRLRSSGLTVEVYPEPKKPATQYTFADRKRIPLALMTDSAATGSYTLRILSRRENETCATFEELLDAIRRLLDGAR